MKVISFPMEIPVDIRYTFLWNISRKIYKFGYKFG